MNNAAGAGNGAFGGPPPGQNGQAPQNSLQQQLMQQLSQQLSQQMSQKFPQNNFLSALANMQQQSTTTTAAPQPPQQQPQPAAAPPPNFMNLAQHGNVAGLLSSSQPTNNNTAQAPAPAAEAPTDSSAAASNSNRSTTDLMQQKPPATTSQQQAAAPPPLGHVGEIRAGFQGQPSAPTAASMGNNNNTAAAADAGKDERRKAPGSVIVPCRARGMPMDHNFKTAYFVIPENVKHGEELICSYFTCRNAGVKFRYCSHCKVPVAKRNFRKRHKHGDPSGKDTGDDDEVSVTEEEGASVGGETESQAHPAAVPSQVMASRPSINSSSGASAAAAAENNHDHDEAMMMKEAAIPSQVTTAEGGPDTEGIGDSGDNNSKNRTEEGSHIPSQVTTRGSTSSKKSKSSSKKSSSGKYSSKSSDSRSVCLRSGHERVQVVESRRKRWARLLDKRPQTKDGEGMSLWLMQVLAVSDLWKPLNESEEMPSASLDLIRQCARVTAGKVKKPLAEEAANAKDDLGGTSDSTKDDSEENQGPNDVDNNSNESDNQPANDDHHDGEKARKPSKKRSLLLKKRPVTDIQDDDDNNNNNDSKEPPSSKAKI
ncbi:expressed unknown protein [Seminavis robusta]|uniref:Uncharacterized protein n=1 Tax=Seminavis robusta TaxID=568900 RepID=A0A9N8DSS5_9STRA|nr:expressed unknown protein [Seminavis robusta]|eukprot:Sro345_g122400.1 n/a (596) ;mRNA; f:15353-17238